jgi:hypothetical protein
MSTLPVVVLQALRKIHDRFAWQTDQGAACDRDPDSVSQTIRDLLSSSRPAMIARFGSTELACLTNYLGVEGRHRDALGYIRGTALPWWWSPRIIERMSTQSGFFPAEQPAIRRFCERMLADAPLVDVLGAWRQEEKWVAPLHPHAVRVQLRYLDPFYARTPWTHALAGKRVLVVHPFEKTIRHQYPRRALIFPDGLLPDFTLLTVRAVQSIAGEPVSFPDWFAALDSMKDAMDREDYDIALIGCGAYGFPLAAHAKRRGKVGFHIGGSLQLLFGIRGRRWDGEPFVNEHWVRPAEAETPRNAQGLENACYW